MNVETLRQRLRESWFSFVDMQHSAEDQRMAQPSTAPCSPAPGRQLLILRDDVQPAPSGMFLSFDGILSSSNTSNSNPYEKQSSQKREVSGIPFQPSKESRDNTSSPSTKSRKKWGLLKSLATFSISNHERATSPTPPNTIRNDHVPSKAPKDPSLAQPRGRNTSPANTRNDNDNEDSIFDDEEHRGFWNKNTSYRTLSFKFSLEWVNQNSRPAGLDLGLSPPPLPPMAARLLKSRSIESNASAADIDTHLPDIASSKYVGRALAEWGLLVAECESFFQRRKAEGVPVHDLVETPSLSVDSFRRN